MPTSQPACPLTHPLAGSPAHHTAYPPACPRASQPSRWPTRPPTILPSSLPASQPDSWTTHPLTCPPTSTPADPPARWLTSPPHRLLAHQPASQPAGPTRPPIRSPECPSHPSAGPSGRPPPVCLSSSLSTCWILIVSRWPDDNLAHRPTCFAPRPSIKIANSSDGPTAHLYIRRCTDRSNNPQLVRDLPAHRYPPVRLPVHPPLNLPVNRQSTPTQQYMILVGGA